MSAGRRRSITRILSLVAVIAVIFIAVTFTTQNDQTVSLSYYFGLSWEGSLAFLVFFMLFLGVLIGLLSTVVLRLWRRIRSPDSANIS